MDNWTWISNGSIATYLGVHWIVLWIWNPQIVHVPVLEVDGFAILF